MQTSKLAFTAKLASLTAAMALCGGAVAATGAVVNTAPAIVAQASASAPVPPSAKDHDKKARHHHHRHGKHGMHRAALWVPGYGPLGKDVVESLSLNESQTKLVEAAKAEQKALHDERWAAMKSARASKAEQFKNGAIDPQAALKQRDEAHQKMQVERRAVDQKWLAVWDALDDSQRQTVAAHFKERAQKFAQHAEQRKQHRMTDKADKASS